MKLHDVCNGEMCYIETDSLYTHPRENEAENFS